MLESANRVLPVHLLADVDACLVGGAHRQHAIGQRLRLLAGEEICSALMPSARVENRDVAEPRRHAAVADRIDLRRFALAVVERTHPASTTTCRRSCPSSSRTPACWPGTRRRAACRRSCRCGLRRSAWPRELEVVALVVDRPRAAIANEDAALGGGDDLIDADVLLARQQRDVRHALERHGVPRLARTSSRASATRRSASGCATPARASSGSP